jgi:hypothetical protein
MEEQTEEIDIEKVEERFSVLYLSLRALGVQQYLQVQINAEPGAVLNPVPTTRLKQLVNYARWLFGTKKKPPLVAESRDVDDFGRILESETAIQYLERSESPSFAVARRMAGVAESVVAEHLERAADETEEALKVVHLFKSSVRIEQAAKRLGADIVQLLAVFSHLKQELLRGEK